MNMMGSLFGGKPSGALSTGGMLGGAMGNALDQYGNPRGWGQPNMMQPSPAQPPPMMPNPVQRSMQPNPMQPPSQMMRWASPGIGGGQNPFLPQVMRTMGPRSFAPQGPPAFDPLAPMTNVPVGGVPMPPPWMAPFMPRPGMPVPTLGGAVPWSPGSGMGMVRRPPEMMRHWGGQY